MLEEEAMNNKRKWRKLGKNKLEMMLSFLNLGYSRRKKFTSTRCLLLRAHCASHHCGGWRGSLLEEGTVYTAGAWDVRLILLIVLGGLEFSEFAHDLQYACSRYLLPLSVILRSPALAVQGPLVGRLIFWVKFNVQSLVYLQRGALGLVYSFYWELVFPRQLGVKVSPSSVIELFLGMLPALDKMEGGFTSSYIPYPDKD
ncbi:hypothetical protein Tco_1474592 [Tanacetum coccineum]